MEREGYFDRNWNTRGDCVTFDTRQYGPVVVESGRPQQRSGGNGGNGHIDMGIKSIETYVDYTIIETVEITKRPGQTLGFYIREGNGIDRSDGVFISRIAAGSAVEKNGLLRVGEEILAIDTVDVTRMSLDDVVILMSIPRKLVLTIRTRKSCCKNLSCPSLHTSGGTLERDGSKVVRVKEPQTPGATTVSANDLTDPFADDFFLIGGELKRMKPQTEARHKEYFDQIDTAHHTELSSTLRSHRSEKMTEHPEVYRMRQDVDTTEADVYSQPGKRSQKHEIGSWDRKRVVTSPSMDRRLMRHHPDYSSDSDAQYLEKQAAAFAAATDWHRAEVHHPPKQAGKQTQQQQGQEQGQQQQRQQHRETLEYMEMKERSKIEAKRRKEHEQKRQEKELLELQHWQLQHQQWQQQQRALAAAEARTRDTSPGKRYSSDSEVAHDQVRGQFTQGLLRPGDKCNSLPEMENGDSRDELKHWLRKLDKLSFELQDFNHHVASPTDEIGNVVRILA